MTLWAVNMDGFLLRFRHELLAREVQRCFGGDEQSAATVALMMQLSRQERCLEQVCSIDSVLTESVDQER